MRLIMQTQCIECFCGAGDALVHVFLVGVIARSRLVASARNVFWLNCTWYFMFTSFRVAFNAAIFSLPYGQVLLSLARPFLSAMDSNSLNPSSAKVVLREDRVTTEVEQNVKLRRLEGPPPQLVIKDSSETSEVGPSNGKTASSSAPCVSSTPWPSGPPPQLVIKDSSEASVVAPSTGKTAASAEPVQHVMRNQCSTHLSTHVKLRGAVNGERYGLPGVGDVSNDFAVPTRAFQIQEIVGAYLVRLEETSGGGLSMQRKKSSEGDTNNEKGSVVLSSAPVCHLLDSDGKIRTHGSLAHLADEQNFVRICFHHEKSVEECFDIPCADVDGISTPPTPPPRHMRTR